MLTLIISYLAILTPRSTLSSPIGTPDGRVSLLSDRWESGPLLTPAVNFPDPSLILVGSTWYSLATRTIGSAVHIQIASSLDFQNWALVLNDNGTQRDALPYLPHWVNADGPNTWAPDVVQLVRSEKRKLLRISETKAHESSAVR